MWMHVPKVHDTGMVSEGYKSITIIHKFMADWTCQWWMGEWVLENIVCLVVFWCCCRSYVWYSWTLMNINDFSIVYSCFLWGKDDEGVVNRKQFWHHPVKPVQIWRLKIKTTTTTMCQMLLHKPMTVYIWLLYRTFYFWKW